jgi:CheY-like chemotaxis protein
VDKNIQLKQQLLARDHTIMGDTSQIRNAVLNLAMNACDAIAAEGVVRFETENISAEALADDAKTDECVEEYLKLSVIDNGVGMDEGIKSQIFEPFFTTKEVGKGTGMGLAAVYGTIDNHKGIITVDSAPGQGAVFTVLLPVYREETKDDNVNVASAAKEALTIMIVDDEPLFRELATDLLECEEHQAIAFDNGERAITYYQENWQDIDVILLDLMMPGLSGKEIFKQIRRINADALIIVASGYSLEGEARDLLQMGALSFVQKPFEKEALDNALSEAWKYLHSDA